MVVNNFNINRALFGPDKTKAPLVIDSDAVLPLPRTLQRFKPVTGWRSKEFDGGGGVQLRQLASDGFRYAGKMGALAGGKKSCRLGTFE